MNGAYSKRKIFFAACTGMAFFGISLITLGSVLPSLSMKFNLNEFQASSVVTFLPAGLLLGSLVFGPFVDRFGYKFLLIFSSVLTAAGLAWIASAGGIGDVRLAVFLTGFGGGILNGETNTIVSDISGDNRDSNLSFLSIFFGIGALGIPAVMGALSGKYPFETLLTGAAIIMMALTIFFFFIKFPTPKQARGFPVKEGLKLLKEPALLLLSLVLFFQSGLEGLSNNWTTTYLENAAGIDREEALFALTLLVAGMTVTRLLLGFMLRKTRSHKVLIVSLFVILAGIIILLIDPVNDTVGITLLGIGYAPVFPVILGYIGTLYSDLSGTAFSIALFIALAGNTSLNFLMGLSSGISGIGAFPFMLLASLLTMSAILVLVLRNRSLKTRNL